MIHKNMFLFTCLAAILTTFSCAAQKNSALALQTPQGSLSLTALNTGAETARIQNPEKSPYLYFAFAPETQIPAGSALQITVKTDKETEFAFGFLTADDFKSPKTLKKQLAERPLVQGKIPSDTDVSVLFAANGGERGFFVHAREPLEVTESRIVPAKFGWKRAVAELWFGYGTNGGTLTEESAAAFLPAHEASFAAAGAQIRVFVEAPSSGGVSGKKIKIAVGKNAVEIQQAPQLTSVVLNTLQFAQKDFKTAVEGNSGAVWGIVFESAELAEKTTPIFTDPGLILNWNRENWRQADFEVFRWQQIPSVLFFDTADYAVQDDFFKRLAFFVEKSGYKGRLVSAEEVAGKHAYNAHDYRAADLARFFETARRQNFTLNQRENLLRQILLDNGIILNSGGSFIEGTGAIVSISRESPEYLRQTFIAHEGLHALYFTDNEFRTTVTAVYGQTDPKSMRFLLRYFAVTSSLNYDLNDTYLIHNEFMGYVMQQPVSRVADYFTKSIATRPGIVQAEPALVTYIIETNAQAFTNAAVKLDAYVSERWGYNAGRVWLVRRR